MPTPSASRLNRVGVRSEARGTSGLHAVEACVMVCCTAHITTCNTWTVTRSLWSGLGSSQLCWTNAMSPEFYLILSKNVGYDGKLTNMQNVRPQTASHGRCSYTCQSSVRETLSHMAVRAHSHPPALGCNEVLGPTTAPFSGFRALNSNVVPPFFHKT
jgi:hypothetical protein